jgi:hypothetical protein
MEAERWRGPGYGGRQLGGERRTDKMTDSTLTLFLLSYSSLGTHIELPYPTTISTTTPVQMTFVDDQERQILLYQF